MPKEILRNQAIKEIFKCARDPIYFIENYCKIQHPDRGLINFNLYPFQKEAVQNLLSFDKNIINKARQLGFSTVTACFITWLILFHNNKSVLIVSTKADVAKNLLRKIKLVLKHLPDWMYLADITTNQAHMLGLSNGSWVKSIARSEDAGRSESLSLLVVDEAAHIRDMEEMWKGLYSTIATGGKVVVLSTPKGINWFYKYCKESQENKNGFHYQEVRWWENPDYSTDLNDDMNVPGGKTSSWFKSFTSGMNDREISQELLTSFIDTGDTYFDSETMIHYKSCVLDPIRKEYDDKCLWIWKDPIFGHAYLLCADPAMGNAKDSCTFYVIDLKTLECVAEYKGKIAPDILGELLVDIAIRYNKAHIVVENNSFGMVTNYQIKNNGYEKLCYFNENLKLMDKWYAEYKSINPGFTMNAKTRPMVLSKMEEMLRKKFVKIASIRFVNELETFVIKDGRPQALKGHNDDLVMALAIGLYVRDVCPEFGSNTSNIDAMTLVNAMVVNVTTPDYNSHGNSNAYSERIKQIAKNQQQIKVGNAVLNLPYLYKF